MQRVVPAEKLDDSVGTPLATQKKGKTDKKAEDIEMQSLGVLKIQSKQHEKEIERSTEVPSVNEDGKD